MGVTPFGRSAEPESYWPLWVLRTDTRVASARAHVTPARMRCRADERLPRDCLSKPTAAVGYSSSGGGWIGRTIEAESGSTVRVFSDAS